MSASNKKKLRREQEAAKLTEKQLAAQAEAKKTSMMTTAFVIGMVAILVIALFFGGKQIITSQGILEKNTTAMTIGDHKLSNAELNYFFIDSVNNFYSQYGSYASMFGLDLTKPLNEQFVDEEAGITWADDFLATAKDSAVSIYAMADAAKAAGYSLPAEEEAEIDTQLESLNLYATMYGYGSEDQYLKAMYGNGASMKGYEAYVKLQALASSYYNHYGESLEYTEDAIRAKEAENFNAYSSYSFNSYYLAASKFLTGGTTAEDGTTTYSDEEKAASVAAAKEAADSILAQEIGSVAAFDAAIAALSANADTTAASTANTDTLYSSVNTSYAEWIADESRKEGDMGVFANETTTTNEDGTETTTVNGYYVVYYIGSTDNNFAMKDVRHILVSFEHDHTESEDHDHSAAAYTDAEKAAAKATAEEILTSWKNGEATEESFAALANEKSADGDGTTGGLYENVYPGQMVDPFEDWCYDASRKTGDTGIVESTYGYHVMYFVGDSEQTYRDYMIENALRSADVQTWYNSIIEANTLTDGETKYLNLDLVLSNGQ